MHIKRVTGPGWWRLRGRVGRSVEEVKQEGMKTERVGRVEGGKEVGTEGLREWLKSRLR